MKARDILGLPIIYDDGRKSPGFLKDIIINICEKQVNAFVAEKTGFRKNRLIFGFDNIRDIGGGALIVKSISGVDKCIEYKKSCNTNKSLSDIDKKKIEIKVYSKNGEDLGLVKDIFFDLQTGYIEAFELSNGLIEDIIEGRKIIPLIGKYEFSEDNIIVDTEAVQEMIEVKSKIRKKILE